MRTFTYLILFYGFHSYQKTCHHEQNVNILFMVTGTFNYCAFSKDHKYPKWIDYQVTRQELEEADELCHGNWIEIQHHYEYILRLQELLTQRGIEIPPEY